MPSNKVIVASKELAFWESLFECDAEPTRYLKRGEQVEIVGTTTVYGGLHGDKEYYKVKHHIYGLGYMLKEGVDQNA